MDFFMQVLLISTVFGIFWLYSAIKLVSPIFYKKGYWISVITFIIIQIIANYALFISPLYTILKIDLHPFLFSIITYSIQFVVLTFILNYYYKQPWKILSALGFSMFFINTFHTLISYIALTIMLHLSISFASINHLFYNVILHCISSLFAFILAKVFTHYNLSSSLSIFFKTKKRTLITTIICASCWNIHAAIFVFYPILPLSFDANLILGFIFLLFISIIFIFCIIMQNRANKLALQNVIIQQRNFHIEEVNHLQQELRSLKHDIKNLTTAFLFQQHNNTKQLTTLIENALIKSKEIDFNPALPTTFTSIAFPFTFNMQTLKEAVKDFFKSPSLLLLFTFACILSIAPSYLLYNQVEQDHFILLLFTLLIICLLITILLLSIFRIALLSQTSLLQEQLLYFQEYYVQTTSSTKQSIASMHSYYTTLLSYLSSPLDENTIHKIEVLIDTPFTPTNSDLDSFKGNLEALHNIKIPELKNLILLKCTQMIHLKIPFVLEVLYPLQHISVSSVDLVRSLGILLDNAIEEVMEIHNPKITLILLDEEDSIYININNTLHHTSTNIHKIYTYGYSSKGSNRGIGLSNYKKIIGTYRNVTTSTKIHNNLFIQELIIQK